MSFFKKNMLNFLPLEDKEEILDKYFQNQKDRFCDLSIGVKYMWRREYSVEYAVYNDTLVIKESSDEYDPSFYYPIGKDVEGALDQIEKYCKNQNLPLVFGCVSQENAKKLTERYPLCKDFFDRDWSDYVYDAQNFKTYSGKKFSGQRNHVNKFKKTYKNYCFEVINEQNFNEVVNFLHDYEVFNRVQDQAKREEVEMVHDLLKNLSRLNQLAGVLKVNGSIVALSIGEIVGDCLVVHVEKALKDYSGAYPTMAQEFALAFATEKVKFINREEDCGDDGLRTSKLQYHPTEIIDKYFVEVYTAFDKIVSPITIETERLVVCEIDKKDLKEYKELSVDEELNEFWGYDYSEDLNGKTPDEEYFYQFVNQLKKGKEEYPVAVKLNGLLIGEVTLHGFDYQNGVEIGFRIKKEYQNKGYAKESVGALIEYAFNCLSVKKVKAKCYHQNRKSKNLLLGLGFVEIKKDQNYFHFEKTRN